MDAPDEMLVEMLDRARCRDVFSSDEVVDMLLDLTRSVRLWLCRPSPVGS